MPVAVIDASALAAMVFGEPTAEAVADVDHAAVVALARQTGLSTYDASYLWLARHLGGELVTLDEGLAAAAR